MIDRVIKQYNEAVYDTDRDQALKVVHDAVSAGVSPEDIVFKVVLPAMDLMIQSVGRDGGVSLAQHYMTAQIADAVTTEMVAKFKIAPAAAGRVVIGTAEGDLHSLGKRIVTGCLKALMVEVTDLGVNVAPELFVDEALRTGAQVIAISAMMVHTATGPNGPLKVRELLRQRGLEDRFKIVVGGAPYRFDGELYRSVGADGWAADGISAGRVIIDLVRAARPA
jgi:trimethylamine corrinoid protein